MDEALLAIHITNQGTRHAPLQNTSFSLPRCRLRLANPRGSLWSPCVCPEIPEAPSHKYTALRTVRAVTSCQDRHRTFLKRHSYTSVTGIFPPQHSGRNLKFGGSDAKLIILAFYCERVFKDYYNQCIHLFGWQICANSWWPEKRFFNPFPLFSDEQGPAVFPRDSFLYKETNYNTELQKMKVIALMFQFAYEDRVQMFQSFPFSCGKSQQPENKVLHVRYLLTA